MGVENVFSLHEIAKSYNWMENLKKHFILKVKRLTLFGVIFVYFEFVVFEKKNKMGNISDIADLFW